MKSTFKEATWGKAEQRRAGLSVVTIITWMVVGIIALSWASVLVWVAAQFL